LIQIQSLKEEVGRKTQEQERLIEDRENLTRQLRDLELEMSTLKSKNSKDEEQIRANSQEISHFQHKIYKAEEEASGKIIVFTAQVDNLQKDLLSMQKTKEELDLCCEKLRQEHAQTHTIVDNNIMDLKRTLKEVEDAYQKLNEEYKQYNECKVKLEGRDLEEKGNETRNHEVELRLSNQKLRNTEQLLSEKEEELQQVQRTFHEHIGSKNRMVTELEHQLEKLRKLMKDKDESARQQQSEAIRQLTMRVRDLRNVNDDLRDIISNSRSYCCLC
jgi:chromosome segregation ATPase